MRAVGQQPHDARPVGADDGDDQRRGRRRLGGVGDDDRAPDHRRARREARILRMRRQRAVIARMADDAGEQVQPHRRQRPLPQLARRLAAPDEAPVLRRDRARVPAVSEVVDRAAGDRVAFEDRPFDRGDAAVARQQRRVVADAAEARARERLVADAGMRVGGDDEVGALGNRVAERSSCRRARAPARRPPAPRRRAGRRRGNDDRRELDAGLLAQGLEHRGAEVAGADESTFHGDSPSGTPAAKRGARRGAGIVDRRRHRPSARIFAAACFRRRHAGGSFASSPR